MLDLDIFPSSKITIVLLNPNQSMMLHIYWNGLRYNNYRGDYLIDGQCDVVDPYPSHPPVYAPPPETHPEEPQKLPPYTPGRGLPPL